MLDRFLEDETCDECLECEVDPRTDALRNALFAVCKVIHHSSFTLLQERF